MRSWFRAYRRALLIFIVAAVLDFAGRLFLEFDMSKVVLFEAILFFVASGAFWWAARADVASKSAWRVDVWLLVLFGLAALRSALWAAGLPVLAANLVILLAGLGLVLIVWRRRRRKA